MKRISFGPQYIGFAITESSVDTFTQIRIDLPHVVVKDKLMGFELQAVIDDIETTDVGVADERVQSRGHISRNQADGILEYNDRNMIHRREIKSHVQFGDATGFGVATHDDPKRTDLTVWDQKMGWHGIPLIRKRLFAGVESFNMLNTAIYQGHLVGHIVEFTKAEATLLRFQDEQERT